MLQQKKNQPIPTYMFVIRTTNKRNNNIGVLGKGCDSTETMSHKLGENRRFLKNSRKWGSFWAVPKKGQNICQFNAFLSVSVKSDVLVLMSIGYGNDCWCCSAEKSSCRTGTFKRNPWHIFEHQEMRALEKELLRLTMSM